MRRGWIVFLLAASAGGQDFSEAGLDETIRLIGRGELFAVQRITSWGPRAARAAPALVAAWNHPSGPFKDAVDGALRALGPAALPELAQALKGKNPAARARAKRLLEEFQAGGSGIPIDPAGDTPMLGLFDDTEPIVRRCAARALAGRGAAAVPKLVSLLGDASPRRRHGAACALAFLEPPPDEAMGTLIAAAGDKDASVREAAVHAVGRMRSSPEETLRCLLSALADPADGVLAAAVDGLARRGPGIAPQLIAAWDGDDAVARHASECLVRLGDAALGPVTEALRSGTPKRKRVAAICLGRLGAARDVPVELALTEALKDPDTAVRLAAADSFGTVSPQVAARGLDALLAAARDPDTRVRASAVAAAFRGAPQEPAVFALLAKAKEDPDPAVKILGSLPKARSPEEWVALLRSPVAPVAARLLAAERLGGVAASAAAAIEPLARVVTDRVQPPEVRAAAADALGAIRARRIFDLRYGAKDNANTRGFRAAAERGLAWLARTQKSKGAAGDGRWVCDGLDVANHDVGVTALALLAFLAAGETDRTGPHAENVRDGFESLLSKQEAEGLFRDGPFHDHTLVEHAMATLALCELAAMTGDPGLRAPAQKAVDHCCATRGEFGWKYGPRARYSDTDVTAWMLTTLRVADEVGLRVDPSSYGAIEWIEKMTEPNFGIVGYESPGGASFRPPGLADKFPPEKSCAMTAAGIFCRMLVDEDPRTSEMIRKGADCCVGLPPKWDPDDGSIDMYYWYWSSLALYQVGGTHWRKWSDAMAIAIAKQQRGDEELKGSWDPLCVWGGVGGRVYSTAICTLALLTQWRYPAGWSIASKRAAADAAVVSALTEAAASPYDVLRAAARRAVASWPVGE